jgi:peroxiredoxin
LSKPRFDHLLYERSWWRLVNWKLNRTFGNPVALQVIFELDDDRCGWKQAPMRSQLLVYHFMFGPDYKAGCPSCSAIADGFNGIATHLANHDVMLWAVSRAPLAKLQAYKKRMGWSFPWASSFGGDFNFDFSASFSEEEQRESWQRRNDEPGL